MATLRKNHAPVPWGAQVEKIVWERSRSGKPRRKRSDRPPLIYDPGWDWDGTRILFSEESLVHDGEESDYGIQAWQLQEDASCQLLSGRTHATPSLLDIARWQAAKRPSKASSILEDFEVIRIPKVVPILEEEPDLGDSWELGEWEKLDAFGFKRTYSEVARGFVEKGLPNLPDRPRFGLSRDEDDSWECL